MEIKRVFDIEKLVKMRMRVIDAVFDHPDGELMERLRSANRDYYVRHLIDDTHISVLAYEGEDTIGSGGICLYDEMPSPDNVSGRCAYLMNIYVDPSHRRKGVASAIVRRLVELAKDAGAEKIYLEATDMATSLYEHLGFMKMKNMMEYDDDAAKND